MTGAPFPREELDKRLRAVCTRLEAAGLDGIVVSLPENIYYLTGLDHWGFFACHMLVVPRDGEIILVARAMETVTVGNQVVNARFLGHGDDEDPADYGIRALTESGLAQARIGIEMRSLFLTPRIADTLRAGMPGVSWVDASGLIDGLRLVKSPLEMDYVRRAARAADAGTQAAINALCDGARDYDVAAACHDAMIRAGSEYPGFGPFIRPTSRLAEEHTTWRGDIFRRGDAAFLEIAASYRKYQAPMGRLVYIGKAPAGTDRMADVAIEGMAAIVDALKPGARAGDVYAAWHRIAAKAGLADYHRHHCGYLVSIGFPPSWTGGSMVTALSPGSELILETGMTFHAHSWFTGTGQPDFFISNTVLLGEDGPEVLTTGTPEELIEK